MEFIGGPLDGQTAEGSSLYKDDRNGKALTPRTGDKQFIHRKNAGLPPVKHYKKVDGNYYHAEVVATWCVAKDVGCTGVGKLLLDPYYLEAHDEREYRVLCDSCWTNRRKK